MSDLPLESKDLTTGTFRVQDSCFHAVLGGQGDLVSRLIMGINGVIIRVIGAVNLLRKSL